MKCYHINESPGKTEVQGDSTQTEEEKTNTQREREREKKAR